MHCINLLNRLASLKKEPPTLYSITDWTRDYADIDYAQLQQLNYHTYALGWDMQNEVHRDFLQAFRNHYSTEPTSQLAPTAYDLLLYIGTGLHQHGTAFWQSPSPTMSALMQPLHLVRHGAGLENDKAQLYRLVDLHFEKAKLK